jgi:ABC-type bacteriocin/lantibiotic exporter with double-glycine peptidase domain
VTVKPQTNRTNAPTHKSGAPIFTVGFTGGLALVVERAAHGTGSIGELVLTVTVAANLRNTLHGVVISTAGVAQVGRFIEPLFWMRDHLAEDRAHRGGIRPAPRVLSEGITFDRVDYAYPGTIRMALEDISVHLPAGSIVAVVGEYGSGRTTLVQLLAKFYRADAGHITVDARPRAPASTGGL